MALISIFALDRRQQMQVAAYGGLGMPIPSAFSAR